MFSFLSKSPRPSSKRSEDFVEVVHRPKSPPCLHYEDMGTFCIVGEHDHLIEEARRNSMKLEAHDFRNAYTYGTSLDNKTLVWPGGTHRWQDKTSGTLWVGVHGLDSICAVTKTGDLDLTRVHRDYKYLTIQAVLRIFRKTIITEIEDLASTSNKLCENFGPSIPKPFGVVSVILPTDNDHEEESVHEASSDEYEEDEEDEGSSRVSSAEYESKEDPVDRLIKALLKAEKRERKNGPKIAGYDDKDTVKYLREQMRMDTTRTKTIQGSSTRYDESGATAFLLEKMTALGMEAFNVDETIKTAISAFQHLFQKEFKANEIEVTVMGPRCFGPLDEAVFIDTHVKELEMSEIKYHLDTINGLCSACWCDGFFFIQRLLLGQRPASF